MSELYPSDNDLNALSGTSDVEQEVAYPTIFESPYYTTFYKMLYRLLDVARRAGDLRVCKDGDLTFEVKAGRYFNGDTAVNYAGASTQALADDATNYIYLTAAGVLTVNTTGFPVPSVTPHIPLASIATGSASAAGVSGEYNHADITDYRGRGIFSVCGAAAGNLNGLDWQESVADELDFTSAEPASPTLGDRYINTGTGSSSETGQSVTANYIYEWNGTSWTEITPTEGACCLVEDRDMLRGFNGSAWVDLGTFAALRDVTDGGNADTLHVHGTTGLELLCVTAAILATDAVETAKIKDRNVTDIKRAHMTVEENTAGSGSPNVLTADESRKVLSNEGSTATNYHLLPTAVAGLSFTFICADASDLIRIVADAGDKIRLAGEVTIAAGYIESTAQGDAIMLIAVDEEYWLATSIVGTWNVETS